MADLEKRVFDHEWNLPQDSPLGMLAYAAVQEQATFINYRNLRKRAAERGGDPALEQLLEYVAIDEAAHHKFFRDCLAVFLKHDRPAVVEQLRRVMTDFRMPAIHDLLDNSHARIQGVQNLEIFSVDIYYREVYLPVLKELGVDRNELRNKSPTGSGSRSGSNRVRCPPPSRDAPMTPLQSIVAAGTKLWLDSVDPDEIAAATAPSGPPGPRPTRSSSPT